MAPFAARRIRFTTTTNGQNNPAAVHLYDGDLSVDTAGKGVVLKSPSGTCYYLTVADGGTLPTTLPSTPCPNP
jgi:hypothetical protein